MIDANAYPNVFTPEQARERVCPNLLMRGFDTDHQSARCIAARCMAWRWGYWSRIVKESIPREADKRTNEQQMALQEPGWVFNDSTMKWERAESVPTHGFCGLAGSGINPD